MKKILAIASMAAMVAGAAFAEVTFGAWGRSGLDFVNLKTGSDTTTVVATPDWASGSRVGFNVAGNCADENIGFNLNVDSNGGTIGIGDQAKIWAKLGFVQVQFGKIQLDDLRGSIGDWGNRDIGSKGEDDIFTRFNPQKGMTIAIRPVDGLFFGAAINSSVTTVTEVKNDAGKVTTEGVSSSELKDVFAAAQVGFGYTVANVAQFKAQYIGDATKDSNGRIEIGADLLCVPNNTIEIGTKIYLKDEIGFFAIAAISGGADALSYKGHVYGDIAGKTVGLDGGAEYNIGVCALGGTGKFSMNYDTSDIGFGVEAYAKKPFSNGFIFAGVADSATKAKNADLVNTFSVPVGVEYWF